MPNEPPRTRRNRACQRCRTRKMKCDAQRPQCSSCQSLQTSCVYELDRRQASRVSKDTVEMMSQKMATLEETLANMRAQAFLGESAQSPTHPEPHRQDFRPNTSTLPQTSLSNLTASEIQMPTNLTRVDHQQISSPIPQARQTEIQVHSLGQSDTGLSVHGPTSTFTGPTLPSITADSPSSAHHSPKERDQMRQRLFAYSALQFQKEYTYMAERKFDLDGLDWDTANHLFALHWNHQHLGFLMTYRPAVMESLATGGPHCNKLLLNAIYYTSALQSDRPNMRDDPAHPEDLGSRIFVRFQSLLGTTIQNSTPASIAALVAMGSSCVSNGRQTIGWLYAGIAYRMIVDLGMHIDTDKVRMSSVAFSSPSTVLSEVDLEIRRRYTWAAYINDRFQSLYFGRPPSLDMIEGISPSQTLLDTYEELEIWRPYTDPSYPQIPMVFTPQPVHAVSTWSALLRLAEITSVLVGHFYTPKACALSVQVAHHEMQTVQRQLDHWAESLAPHLRFEPGQLPVPPPTRFYLHTTFSVLHILLHRPFLTGGHLESLAGDRGQASLEICITAALRIYHLARVYREVFTLRRATYLFSYAVFSAATILPLHSTLSTNASKRVEIVTFFWNALKELQNGANFGLSKPIAIIKGMFERAGIDLNALASRQREQSENGIDKFGRRPSPVEQSFNLPVLRDSGLDGLDNIQYQDLFNELSMGVSDWSTYDMTGDLSDELLYGLFRQENDIDFETRGNDFPR